MSIRVLMVTDAEGSYTEAAERFGLTELVKALEEGDCEVTKAHRWNAAMPHTAGADIKGFKFNAAMFDADAYDVVWLVGFASNNPNGPYHDDAGFQLSAAEVETLAAFMNDGGGVFATGDHDDLGADLCGMVPRVRSMRRWEADYGWLAHIDNPDLFVPDPNKSPPPIGQHRLDTLMTGHNAHYEFADQSDDVPQRIYPVMHLVREHISHVAGGDFGYRERMPHPLLCGTDGVISVLPDHMHEGRCLVPDDLTATFQIGGQTFDEYPVRNNGERVSPEVVAWAEVKARTNDPNFDDPTESVRESDTNVVADTFPVIVAYNGHRAGVGRVAVDATFHHFTNINVTGVKSAFSSEPDAPDAVKAQGFLASPEGMAQYGRIKNYWRNIARWLCRPKTLQKIFWSKLIDAALDPRLKQTAPIGEAAKLAPQYLRRYGASAWDLMIGRSSPCSVITWVFDIAIPDPLSYLLSYAAYIRLTLPDPPPDGVRLRERLQVDRLELAQYALGAIMLELRRGEHREALRSGKLDAERGMALVRRAARNGLQRGMHEQAARMERTLDAMKQALKLSEAVRAV